MDSRKILYACLGLMSFACSAQGAETADIALAGNAFITRTDEKSPPGSQPSLAKPERLRPPGTTTAVYFHLDRAADLELSLHARSCEGDRRVAVTVANQHFETLLKVAPADYPIGRTSVDHPGYVKVELQALDGSGECVAEMDSLSVKACSRDLTPVKISYVKDNDGNRFYWGRRGPSVHLAYQVPRGKDIEWFYNEVTVPERGDPVGTYVMANGFGEGYFGIQVTGFRERKVLFSVWSPFKTDQPKDIPTDRKVVVLKKGEGVQTGEFGGEGAGGQSFWIYPWQAGITYRFLNRAHPDGHGSTIYTAWFFLPEKNAWKLIASFSRPATDKHLTGLHSFLENFADTQGFINRAAFYGRQWACDTSSTWHELTEARFTCDDIASRRYRLDFEGGENEGRFFLHNGGFFDAAAKPGVIFKRVGNTEPPAIDFAKLEGFE